MFDKLQFVADGVFKYFDNIENKPCNLHMFCIGTKKHANNSVINSQTKDTLIRQLP